MFGGAYTDDQYLTTPAFVTHEIGFRVFFTAATRLIC